MDNEDYHKIVPIDLDQCLSPQPSTTDDHKKSHHNYSDNVAFALTGEQKRRISELLQGYEPNINRFAVSGIFDWTKVLVRVELCYGKFYLESRTFEYEVELDGSDDSYHDNSVRKMKSVVRSWPKTGYYVCSNIKYIKQHICDLLCLLKIVEDAKNVDNEAQIETNASARRLFYAVNGLLWWHIKEHDTVVIRNLDIAQDIAQTNKVCKIFLEVLIMSFFVLGFTLLMFGYNSNTGYLGPAFYQAEGTVLTPGKNHVVTFAYNGRAVYNYTSFYSDDNTIRFFGTNQRISLVTYLGGTVCDKYSSTNIFRHYGDQLQIAAKRTNPKSCFPLEDLSKFFTLGVVFLCFSALMLILLLIIVLSQLGRKEPEEKFFEMETELLLIQE
jgi:hypothetical protein